MNLPVPASASPALIRGAMSPLAVGGAAAGLVFALFTGGGLLGIVILILIGWAGGTAAAFLIGRGRGRGLHLPQERIDPFAVGEPWRYFVRDAVTARNRFDDALRSTKPGPLQDRLATIRASVDDGVRECWEVAKQAQHISEARKALDVPTLRRKLQALEARDDDTTVTEGSVRAQLESAARLDAVLADVTSKLEVLEAQLTEAVARAIEVSALAGHDDELAGVGSAVDQVVDNLEALRAALVETNRSPGQATMPNELPPAIDE